MLLRPNPPIFKKFKRSPGGVQERNFNFLTIKVIFFQFFDELVIGPPVTMLQPPWGPGGKMPKKVTLKSKFSPLIARPEMLLRPNPPRFEKFKRSTGRLVRTTFWFFDHKGDFFSIFGRNGQKSVFGPISPQNPVRPWFCCQRPKMHRLPRPMWSPERTIAP